MIADKEMAEMKTLLDMFASMRTRRSTRQIRQTPFAQSSPGR